MDWLWIFLIVFLAIFTQSVTGFGLALVSMPLLTTLLGIQTAAPLVALVGLIAEFFLLIYYREAFNMRVVWRLIIAAVFGIPLGVLALRYIPEEIVLTLLGIIVGGYALYALLDLRLPTIQQPIWAYGAGFFAGILGGAYNTFGPPVIVYGNCRRWPPAEFKSNLQGFFLLNSFLVVGTHTVAQNYTTEVWRSTLVALPAIAAGIIVGLLLASRISNKVFRRIVLWLLLVLGVWLVVVSI
jgi:uncharacterized membrane protein YfcA